MSGINLRPRKRGNKKNTMNTSEIVEQVKGKFEELTRGIPLRDYVDVCGELGDEFSTRAEAGQVDLDREEE